MLEFDAADVVEMVVAVVLGVVVASLVGFDMMELSKYLEIVGAVSPQVTVKELLGRDGSSYLVSDNKRYL